MLGAGLVHIILQEKDQISLCLQALPVFFFFFFFFMYITTLNAAYRGYH